MANVGALSSPASAPASPNTGPTQTLGQSDFLNLLTTELQNQDPLSPMDETQSIAQLAQFSALQSTDALQSSFSSFQSNFAVMQSASLIGKSVSAQATDSSGTISTVNGTVQSVSVVNGQPEFTLVNSAGKQVTDPNGAALLIPTTGILSVGG